jgi:hypothetical protein
MSNDNPLCTNGGPGAGGNENAAVSAQGGLGRIQIQLVKGGKHTPYDLKSTDRNGILVNQVLCELTKNVGDTIVLDGLTQGGRCSSQIHAGTEVQVKVILENTLIHESRIQP